MIRLLIAALMVVIANGANAFGNEELYKWCKGYVDSGFKPNQDAMLCRSYMIGVLDSSRFVCDTIKLSLKIKKPDANWQILLERSAVGVSEATYDQVIQHYVNRMQNEPEVWGHNAGLYVVQSMQVFAPCKLD